MVITMTPFSCTVDILSGFGAGHQYSSMKAREDEIKQGKNYYNASLYQIGQIGAFAGVISRIAEKTLSGTSSLIVQIVSEIIPFLLLPVNVLIAAIKQKNYQEFATFWNGSEKTCCSIMPENLGETTVSIASFLAEHTGDIFRVAMIVGVVGLIVLGDIAFGISSLVPLVYQLMNECGWIPSCIAAFLETHLPIFSIIGTLIGGSVILRIVAVLMLPNYLMPSLNEYLLEKMDHLYRYFFPTYGPTLEEMNAEMIVKKDMTFEEINTILDADEDAYEINPAHASKPAFDLSVLPQDDDFDHLITLFDQVDWMQRYTLIKNRLADDEIFIDILSKKHPEVEARAYFKIKINDYINELAEETNVSPARFAVRWVREQLCILVTVLKKERVPKGTQADLAEGIEDNKRMIAYLKALNFENDRVELEDALLKTAIEQGNYCALGIKRAAREMQEVIINKFMAQSAYEEDSHIKNFELNLRMHLETERLRMIQTCYQKGVELLSRVEMEGVLADVHNYEIYRSIFTFGFYPLSKNERSKFGYLDLMLWDQMLTSALRSTFYAKRFLTGRSYLKEGTRKLTIHMFEYIRGIINENLKLESSEKDLIVQKMVNPDEFDWSFEQMGDKFARLMFVMLGIMRKKDNTLKSTPVFFSDYPDPITYMRQYAPKRAN